MFNEIRIRNCLRFANPAEALGGRHLEAWRRCMEAQKLGGSDTLILANSCIFLMASGVLSRNKFYNKMMIIEHNGKYDLGQR